MRITHREIKVALGLALGLCLLYLFVLPGWTIVSRDPVLPAPPDKGMMGLGVPRTPGLDYGQYNWAELNLAAELPESSSPATLSVWVRMGTNAASTSPAVLVISEPYSNALKSCEDEDTTIRRNITYEEMDAASKRLVTVAIRRQLEKQTGSEPENAKVAEVAAQQRYTHVAFALSASEVKDDEEKEVRILTVHDRCQIDNGAFWAKSDTPSDYTFSFPRFSFLEADQGIGDGLRSEAETSVPFSPQWSLLRWNPAPDTEDSSDRTDTEDDNRFRWRVAETRNSSFDTRSADGYRVAVVDSGAGVFRDSVREEKAQSELFLSGIAIGVLGGLVVWLLPEIYNVAIVRWKFHSARRRTPKSEGSASGDGL